MPVWKDTYLNSPYKYIADLSLFRTGPAISPSRPSEISRMWTLTKLRFHYFLQENSIYLLRFVQLFIIALFVGSLFYQVSSYHIIYCMIL